jgi:hypothetical protein
MYHKFTDQNNKPVLVKKGTICTVFSSDTLKNSKGEFCSVLGLSNGQMITIVDQLHCIADRIN